MALERSFVPDSEEIILPKMGYVRVQPPLRTLIITFSNVTIEALLEDNLIVPIPGAFVQSVNGDRALYYWKEDPSIGVFMTVPGAAGTVTFLEEAGYIAGVENFVFYGSCGALDPTIGEKEVIVPTEALRDEGTSYHYTHAQDWITIPHAEDVKRIFDEIGVSYVAGKTWTTDAIYRETKEEIARHREEGCICVEMEVAAVQAMCNLRNYQFYPFVYSADNVGKDKWEQRILGNLPKDQRLEYFSIALELAKKLK